MSWYLRENKDGDRFIDVHLRGRVSFDELVRARGQIAILCREKNYRRVLIDTRGSEVSSDVSTIDLFVFGTDVLEKADMPPDTKTAVILLVNTKAGKDWYFLESVEANRGFFIKSFGNRAQAMKWLMSK